MCECVCGRFLCICMFSIFYMCGMFIDMYVLIVYVCTWCGMYVHVCGKFFCCLFNPLCCFMSFQDSVIYGNKKDLAQQFFFPKMPVKLLRVLPTS